MYQASVPKFITILSNLSKILTKGELYAKEKKFSPDVLVNARLAPDMFPFSRQVQIATDTAKGCAARLAGIEVPKFPDVETSITELQTRIEKVIEFLQTVSADMVDGSETREINLKVGPRELKFNGQDYLLNFVIPNIYFHVTVAYAILRHNGVDVGKTDYLGEI